MTSNPPSGKPRNEIAPINWLEEETIAFVAQVPWIENASIKENILSGLPYVEKRYHETLLAAALSQDLDVLEDGDLTEVGSQGINLSGGQRWRITFARALYSRAGILILDDILSAVDAHVGRHIFFNGLAGPLGKGRTRILATHHTSLCLAEADFAIHLSRRGEIRQLPLPITQSQSLSQNKPISKLSLESSEYQLHEDLAPIMVKCLEGLEDDAAAVKTTSPRALIEKEFRQQGKIPWSLYQKYINASGGLKFWFWAVSVIVTSQIALLARAWWVKVWTQSSSTRSFRDSSSKSDPDLVFFLGIYIVISSVAAFMEAVKCGFVYLAALRASHQLFERLTYSVLRSRLRWLDTTPVGRILNRFTADFALVDSRIPGDTHTLLSALFCLIIIFLVGAAVSFYMILVESLLLVICLLLVSKFLQGAEEIKRLEGTAKSPIFEHYGATLLGLSTIRSMEKADRYRERMLEHIDTLSQCSWASALTTQWMALRISAIGSLFTASVAIVVAINNTNAAAAGFILNFSLDYSKSMDEVVKRFSNLQLNMNSTERIVEYLEIPTEAQHGDDVPRDWPTQGHILLQNLSVKFAPELPDVLRRVDAEIFSGQRVGIVGRTGAGKSTLALALFRFLEAHSGSIEIDGIDIAKIRLHDLRSRMSIVAQDPVLFSGSIRTNLDPMGHYSDSQLHESLNKVHLVDSLGLREQEQPPTDSTLFANLNVFENLDSPVSEGGLNLSHGQRQLLSLARAILNQSKIMVMDEATSSIDTATDSLIQRAIREEFADSTLLVIAHRLSTVADFDKVLVIDNGMSVEFGHPRTLMEQKGEFWKLVCESGERQKIEDMIYGPKLVNVGER